MSYGTGSIMAVPGHDERDFDFAKKFELPIIEVVEGGNLEKAAFTGKNGKIINSKNNFKNVWIQPAAGDAGGSLGAALALYFSY